MTKRSENGPMRNTEELAAALPKQIEPPAELEDKVATALLSRGLIGKQPRAPHMGWQAMRAAFAAAACIAFVALGVVIGRNTAEVASSSPLTGAETDLYALLLYETDGYDRAEGAELFSRFGEYSAWVAEARQRGQFVTGEDLEIDNGWLIDPSGEELSIMPATSIDDDAPLSGVFFIRAKDAEHALELARELPHVKHGGSVLVQKTIPTDSPPPK